MGRGARGHDANSRGRNEPAFGADQRWPSPTRHQLTEAVGLYQRQGMSLRDVADVCGVPHHAVAEWLEHAGVPLRSADPSVDASTAALRTAALEAYQRLGSLDAAARELGVTPRTVARRVRAAGGEIASRGSPRRERP